MGISFLIPTIGMTSSLSESPILIELFTSQGCSSCPPAEILINGWGMELFHAGKALPLCFHVDYWDSLGWKYPFASPLFTERQDRYASAFGSASLYTPELVISGRSGFVGSDAQRSQQEIEDWHNRRDSAQITLLVSLETEVLNLKIKLQPLDDHLSDRRWKVMTAVFENHLMTHVEKGENSGRDLIENFVVQRLAETKRVSLEKVEWIDVAIPLRSDWQKDFTGVAVFLQDESTLRIGGVNWVYPISQ